jgi:hypothetical protein
MSKEAVFTMKLEPELRAQLMSEAALEDRPASQIVRELMRDYINQRQNAREYDEFLNRKVARARRSMQAGNGIAQEELEIQAARQRAALLRPVDEASS